MHYRSSATLRQQLLIPESDQLVQWRLRQGGSEYSTPPAFQRSSPLYASQIASQPNYTHVYQEPQRRSSPDGW